MVAFRMEIVQNDIPEIIFFRDNIETQISFTNIFRLLRWEQIWPQWPVSPHSSDRPDQGSVKKLRSDHPKPLQKLWSGYPKTQIEG